MNRLSHRITTFCKDITDRWGPVLSVCATILAAIAAAIWFVILPRIEEVKKEATVSAKAAAISPDVVAEISKRVRPYTVVDVSTKSEMGTFTHDAGASEVIDSVTFRTARTNFQAILTVKMKKFVAVSPLVRPLVSGVYINQSWRTNKFDWAYDVRPTPTTVTADGALTSQLTDLSEGAHYSFLIELLTN